MTMEKAAESKESIIIRFATLDDVDNIIEFIKLYWKSEHIFVKDKAFFDYIYITDNRVNFVVGVGSSSSIIYGIRGFIRSNSLEYPDAWGAIWKVRPEAPRGLGRRLQMYLLEELKPRVLVGISISQLGLIAREKLNEQRGKLKHYYRLTDKEKYNIATIHKKRNISITTTVNHKLDEIYTIKQLKRTFDATRYIERRCYKDNWYLEYRYFNYPYYKYRIFGIRKNNIPIYDSILIMREVVHNDARILRIVDFIGKDNDLTGIAHEIDNMLVEGGYEYIDFYQYGISDEIMANMGMVHRKEGDHNIIPNYFEPFENRNIEIDFSGTDITNLYVFKADSDQDRPNLI